MSGLTAGEECQLTAKVLSAFADPRQGAITPPFITLAMGIAIFKGDSGVAVVRLKSGEWSAPCAIKVASPKSAIQPAQDTVLLFMTESAIFSLVGQGTFIFGQTHRFAPGPLYGTALNVDPAIDVYAFVRFNNGFTPSELILQHMNGWSVKEDLERHSKWHGKNATWFDVLTNKISVDRSSVGNALYLVLNMAASGTTASKKNFASIEEWAASFAEKDIVPQQTVNDYNQSNGLNHNQMNLQNQLSPQMSMQNQLSPQMNMQNQMNPQLMQNQMMQNQMNPQMLQNQMNPLMIQNQINPQMMQNQMMQNQMNPQMMQNQMNPQMMQTQMNPQMMQNQMNPQMMQNQMNFPMQQTQPMDAQTLYQLQLKKQEQQQQQLLMQNSMSNQINPQQFTGLSNMAMTSGMQQFNPQMMNQSMQPNNNNMMNPSQQSQFQGQFNYQ